MTVRRVISRDTIQSVGDPAFATTYDGAADDPVRYLRFHETVND